MIHSLKIAAASMSLLAVFAGPVLAEEGGNASDDQERKELESELAAARERLEAAARDVAELSGKLTGPIAHDYFVSGRKRGGAMLGVGMGADGKEGVMVANVMPEGPASKAGLKPGDVIVSIGGKSLKDNASPNRALIRHMRGVHAGDKVKVEYLRDGKKQTAELVAEEMDFGWALMGMPGDRMFRFHRPRRSEPLEPGEPMPPPGAWMFKQFLGRGLDMELVTVTPKLGRYFGAEGGVLVARAPADSAFKLEDGDIILEIDGRQPTSGVHAMRILRSYQPGEKVNFTVLRERKKTNLAVTVPEHEHGGPARGPEPRKFKIPAPPPREESI